MTPPTSIQWAIVVLRSHEPAFVGPITADGMFGYMSALCDRTALFATWEDAVGAIAKRHGTNKYTWGDRFALVPIEVTEPVAASRRPMI